MDFDLGRAALGLFANWHRGTCIRYRRSCKLSSLRKSLRGRGAHRLQAGLKSRNCHIKFKTGGSQAKLKPSHLDEHHPPGHEPSFSCFRPGPSSLSWPFLPQSVL